MSGQSWERNRPTAPGMQDYRIDTTYPPGHFFNPIVDENFAGTRYDPAHPCSAVDAFGCTAPGPVEPDLYGSPANTPSEPFHHPHLDDRGPNLFPGQPAPWHMTPQPNEQSQGPSPPSYSFILPPPSPPTRTARSSLPSRNFHGSLPPPSPPPKAARTARFSSATTLVDTPRPSAQYSRKDSSQAHYDPLKRDRGSIPSRISVQCDCCLKNPVSYREKSVSWCSRCFEIVLEQRAR